MDTVITRYFQLVMASPEWKVSAFSLKYDTFRDLWKDTTEKTLARTKDELAVVACLEV